ncbi:MAG: hypothetical protein AB1437_12705 [Pseudomonadota bacterium]
MDKYEQVEELIANKHGQTTKGRTRKAIGDFMLNSSHAVNVKSNNVDKQNYSPNMISIKRMHEWVYKENKQLSFVFVDYEVKNSEINVINDTAPIPIEHISWECLSIEAQGYGAIQKVGELVVNPKQTKRQFYEGFLTEYQKFRNKEESKHAKFSSTFLKDLDQIK